MMMMMMSVLMIKSNRLGTLGSTDVLEFMVVKTSGAIRASQIHSRHRQEIPTSNRHTAELGDV